uniref:Methionine--tRNA ligase, cytoplasmic n=2 Tax=Clastoptera arizonana TaxID=38151 RepID=A0A1B6DHK9_9HEMI
MKLYTNHNNISALKILISANFSGKNVNICFEEPGIVSDFIPKKLPLLETDQGKYLFSANASSFYLFSSSNEISFEVNSWLDWEALHLQPSLITCIESKYNIIDPVIKLVSILDQHLSKSTFLVENNVTVADVVVWCSLYPIMTNDKLCNVVCSNKEFLQKWFCKLREIEHFKDGVATLNPTNSQACLDMIVSSFGIHPSSLSKQLTFEKSSEIDKEKDVAVSDEEISLVEDAWINGSKKRILPIPQVAPVLPKSGEKNVLITSALPYVNNVPHLGNLIGCVLSADVFARYSRLRNWNTLYVSGTDEYGTATETKALEEGLTPKEICDKYFAIHSSIYSWFNIDFDIFGRTTNVEQTEVVQEMFLKCHKNGYTTTSSVEQLLCEKCDRYLADRFVEGTCPDCSYDDARGDQCDSCGHLINATELINPRCKICRSKPTIKESQQLFLDLPKLEPELKDWSSKGSNVWSNNAMVITKAWLKQGLNPRCITRDLKWGIPVPLQGFEQKVFYVWFDAPIGYISMTKKYTEKWREWWKPFKGVEVTFFQFMAKDNVPFHSIMFPATLMACNENYVLVDHLMATEYLNYEDGKFSKSRGIGVFGNDAKDTGIPSDIFRFYLLYIRPEGQDASFSWLDLATKNNTELLNNLGNFINRALVFVEKNFNSQIPNIEPYKEDYIFLALITREVQSYINALDKAKLKDGIKFILNISRHGNFYMQSNQPWVLLKQSDEDKIRAGTILGICCNIACLLGILLKPYMPKISQIIGEQLRAPTDVWVLDEHVYQYLQSGHIIGKPSPLFSKIEMSTVEELKARFSGRQKSSTPDLTTPLSSTNISSEVTKEKMEAAVAKQAELVRTLKASSDKSVWQPQVTVLLDMKKQLAALLGEPEPVTSSKKKSKGAKNTK